MDIMENITILVTWDRHVNHEYSLIGHRIHSLCLPIHILPLFIPPEKIMFTNTKSPFTNLTYHKAGSKRDGEDRFKAYFSVNVNKKLGIGFSFDYLYGRGLYASQLLHFSIVLLWKLCQRSL